MNRGGGFKGEVQLPRGGIKAFCGFLSSWQEERTSSL